MRDFGAACIMRKFAIIISAALLVGCEKPKEWYPAYSPEVFAHAEDRMKERFPELQTVFGPSCLWRGVATQDCFRMTDTVRWRGLWRNEFEGSRFYCEHPELLCPIPGFRIWLTNNSHVEPDGRLYRVEFIGRQTLYPGPFGHLAITDGHEVVVDRMTSMVEASDEAIAAKHRLSDEAIAAEQ